MNSKQSGARGRADAGCGVDAGRGVDAGMGVDAGRALTRVWAHGRRVQNKEKNNI